jgi:hypothetical protein
MANKALAKRQKMTIRVEPSQKAPRNPAIRPIGKRGAASQPSDALVQKPLLQRLLARKSDKEGE